MRVWPTTVGRKLYSSSVLTLTVRASLPRLVGPLGEFVEELVVGTVGQGAGPSDRTGRGAAGST